jgi:lipid-binding SYLF domain-containing protein
MSRKQHLQLMVATALAAGAVLTGVAPQARPLDSRDKMRREAASQSTKAAKVFDAIMQVPDKSIPTELIGKARAIAVFPEVLKIAFTVGGEGGRGVVSRRRADGTWSSPVFLRAGGPSFGAQIGASSTDLFLLIMNDESIESLMKDRVELGGDAGVAAGPVGRHAGAATDALMHAAILSYSRSRGLFAGVDVKGIVVKPEDDLNLAVYNKTAKELFKEPADSGIDAELNAFPRTLTRYTGQS